LVSRTRGPTTEAALGPEKDTPLKVSSVEPLRSMAGAVVMPENKKLKLFTVIALELLIIRQPFPDAHVPVNFQVDCWLPPNGPAPNPPINVVPLKALRVTDEAMTQVFPGGLKIV